MTRFLKMEFFYHVARMFTLQSERFRRGFDDRIEEGELL